jgi:integrase
VPESKNGASRHIPLNAEALAAFQLLYRRSGGKGPIFAAQRGGKQLQGARHWFDDAIEAAKVVDFRWHCLRHTFASRLVMAGVDLRTVAELMGHKKIQMTMRYAHLAPAHKLEAVEKLAEFNRRERTEKTQDEPVILSASAAAAKRTDPRADTADKSNLETVAVNVQ